MRLSIVDYLASHGLLRGPTCLAIALAIPLLLPSPFVTAAPGNSVNTAQREKQIRALEPGTPVEREIGGGQEHAYRIALMAGQFLRVVAEQKGLSLTLVLVAPDGKPTVEANFTGAGGPESLAYEVSASGDWQLIVRASLPVALSGWYRARIDVRAHATEQDRQRMVAERLLHEADQLNSKGRDSARLAIEKAEQALVQWRQLGDQVWEANTLSMIAVSYRILSRYENSIEYFEKALSLAQSAKYRYGEGHARHGAAMPYGLLGRHEKSAESAAQALTIWREVTNRSGETSALNNLTIAYSYLDRYEKAIEYGEQSLALLREAKNRAGMGNILNNMGNAYKWLGLEEKAVEYYEQSLIILRETKNEEGQGAVLGNIGRVYESLGRHEKAIEFQEQALTITRSVKDRPVEARTLANLGDANRSLGRYDKAIGYYEQALAIQQDAKMRVDEGMALGNLGITYNSMGRHEKAVEYLNRGLTAFRETRSPSNQAVMLYNLAKAERDRGDLIRARALIEEGLQIDKALRSTIYSRESRASYFALSRSYYEFYIDLFMRLHKEKPAQGFDALALEASEGARARGLLELLTEAGANIREGVDATLVEKERTVAGQLNVKAASQVDLLTKPHTAEQAAALKQEISQLESEYEQAQAAIRRTSPRYAALTQPQTLSLTEIQQQLDPQTLLLEYSLGEEGSYLWAVTRDSITSFKLPKEQQITDATTTLYNLLTARTRLEEGETAQQKQQRVREADAQLPQAAREVSSMLLGPVAPQLGKRRLVIVADGALQYIPFAMLPKPAFSGQAYEPLIVSHEVVSLPSASTIAVQRKELAARKLAPRMVAVIADPVFSRTDERLKVNVPAQKSARPAAAEASDARSTRILAHLSGTTTTGVAGTAGIARLPFTRREADQIMSVAPGKSNLVAMDFKASRETVMSAELREYRYVHFATHGYLDSARPGLSALVLSMVDEQGTPQDGFFRANEVYNLTLPAELVVLSACQTGLGKEIKGEGLIGLTRGFMYAGAARVAVSLWSVNDKATSELMARFYQKMLKEHQRPAAALRAAQVEMFKQRTWESPFFWAAFVLQGEWR